MTDRRINVRGIIYKDGKILAQKFRTDNGGESEYWGTPGGGLDAGEPILSGLQREIVEETGITPSIGALACVHQFMSVKEDGTKREMLELFFMITNADAFENINLETTTHGAIEIAECEFVDPKTVNILPKFLQVIDFEQLLSNDVLVDSELPVTSA